MISNIGFENFKCLDKKGFKLSKINLFSGYNGKGKSSVMQSLLLLAQSIKNEPGRIDRLHLKDEFLNLGEFDELLTNPFQKDTLSFDIGLLTDTDHTLHLEYKKAEDPLIGELSDCVIDGKQYFDTAGTIGQNNAEPGRVTFITNLPVFINALFSSNVHYISADRKGPVHYVEKQERPENHRVGCDGKYTINTLATYSDEVTKELNPPEAKVSMDLKEAASGWMNFIMGDGTICLNGEGKENGRHNNHNESVLSLGYKLQAGNREFQAYNVGYGYSYVLSIIVTALIARKGHIVIIENPEAHIHPSAQKKLTFLLAQLASSGVQVFIETHSEHIVNGFRLASLKEEFAITNQDICLYFFDKDFSVQRLEILPNGRIDRWPEGFFNQSQNDLAEIMYLGAKIK